MGYIYNKEELNLAKVIIKKYNPKSQSKLNFILNNKDLITYYIEDILYKEYPMAKYIKKIMIDNYRNENIEIIDETFFVLENFKILKNNKHWGFTFYIYTKNFLYYANGLINKNNKYFSRISFI